MISAVHCGQRCPLTASWDCDLLMIVSRVCNSTSRRLSTIISTSSTTSPSYSKWWAKRQLETGEMELVKTFLLNQPYHTLAGTESSITSSKKCNQILIVTRSCWSVSVCVCYLDSPWWKHSGSQPWKLVNNQRSRTQQEQIMFGNLYSMAVLF